MVKQNRLGTEKSPYLLQHCDNPVHWFPWSEEAIQSAQSEAKPIFLSIGYSTCYWCHVMERESFENQQVADLLNQFFISIKVDREERPDIDHIYMDAVVAMTGQGGWPLTVVLTPDLEPFFGATYIPRPQLINLLTKIDETWTKDKERILQSAGAITESLRVHHRQANTEERNAKILLKAVEQLGANYDAKHGGFGHAPKFPPATTLSLLLRIYRRTQRKELLDMVNHTLDQMARGGIYDQLGGGFHRYSTDSRWLIPHFEKMLYDNALLAVTYLEAYQLSGEEMFASVARESMEYVLREMTADHGGFFSAQDAGEVGREGEYYVWQEEELDSLLSHEESTFFKQVYGVSTNGNFESSFNVLNLQQEFPWPVKSEPLLQTAHRKLSAARNERRHPHKDDKILTSWNGLMISAMAKSYQVLGNKDFLQAAERCARFLQRNLFQNGKLLRRFRDGDARYPAYLEDYAYLIQGLLDLYESDFNIKWLNWANKLQAVLDNCFWDKKESGYFFTEEGDPSIIIRKKDHVDGAIPSANGVSARNLLRLYHLTFKEEYRERSQQLFDSMSAFMNRFPSSLASALIALDFELDRVKEIVVIGSEERDEVKQFRDFVYQTFIPNKVFSIGQSAGIEDTLASTQFRGKLVIDQRPTFYVCENNTCKLPTNDIEKAKELLAKCEGYSLEE